MAMTDEQAVKLAGMLLHTNPYMARASQSEKREQIQLDAALIMATMGTAPLAWAEAEMARIVRQGEIPAVRDLAAGWRNEARHRLANAPAGRAPAAVEDDAAAYREWERARRHAILSGADADRAQAYANQVLGVAPDRPAITAGQVAEAKASFMAARAVLARGPQTVDGENR